MLMQGQKCEFKSALVTAAAVSGHGGYHTARSDAKNTKPYTAVNFQNISSMVKNPASVPKDKAQWAIFSTTGGENARVHQHQREHGQYFGLWGDLDKVEGLTFLDICQRVQTAIPGHRHIIYTSKSATTDNPKSRVILLLNQLISGSDYAMVARILNNRLEASGLPPDRATERPGQLCYLPNRGEFYHFQIIDGPLLDPYEEFKDEIIAEQARLKKEQQECERRHRAAIQKAQERINAGQVNPIEAFRENYPVGLALERYGYYRRGKKYLSPLSESGKSGVTVLDNKWYSHHSSDAGIGQPGKDGGTWGDAFDLFVYYEHGGAFNQAVKVAGEMFTTTAPGTGQVTSITQLNQREYMRQKNNPVNDFGNISTPPDPEPVTPLPLEREVEKPEPYPMDALGEILGSAAKIMHEIIKAPDGLCAHSVLGFAAHVTQGHADIIVDGRITPLNENFLSIGSRSARKSECDGKAGFIHKEYQRQILKQHAVDKRAFLDDQKVFDEERKRILASKKTTAEKSKALEVLRAQAPTAPYEPLILFSDPTVEGIHNLFINGTPSKFLCADEGGQVSGGHSMTAEKKVYTATTYSKWWDAAPIDRVRGGDGSSVLYGRRLSMHLMMQDQIAKEFFNDPVMRNQGLLSRFLISFPESLAGTRQYDEHNILEAPALLEYYERIKEILQTPLKMRVDEETDEELNELNPRVLHLDPEAKSAWVSAYNEIEIMSGEGNIFKAIEGFAGKASNHMIRLAGIMALFDDVNRQTIPVIYVERARALVEYYLNERLRVIKMAEPVQGIENAKKLLQWLKQKNLKTITLADVYQRGPSSFRTKKQATDTINVLEEHHWLTKLVDGGESKLTSKKSAEAWKVNNGKI